MIPIVFEVERSIDEYLMSNLDSYLNLGIKLRKVEDLARLRSAFPLFIGRSSMKSSPFCRRCRGNRARLKKGFIRSLRAMLRLKRRSHRLHRRDGALKSVFALEEPICPHGRTFVIRLNKDDLMTSVGRT